MLSTALELAGFVSLAAAAFLIAGLVALLLVAGVEFLVLGVALDQGMSGPARHAKRQ